MLLYTRLHTPPYLATAPALLIYIYLTISPLLLLLLLPSSVIDRILHCIITTHIQIGKAAHLTALRRTSSSCQWRLHCCCV